MGASKISSKLKAVPKKMRKPAHRSRVAVGRKRADSDRGVRWAGVVGDTPGTASVNTAGKARKVWMEKQTKILGKFELKQNFE